MARAKLKQNQMPSNPALDLQTLTAAFFDAINRFDLDAVRQLCSSEVVRTEPSDFPTPGTYRGIEEVIAHLSRGRGTWEEGTCSPESLVVLGDLVVANLYVDVKVKDRADRVVGRFADVLKFADGKVVEFHTFGDRQVALNWATAQAAL